MAMLARSLRLARPVVSVPCRPFRATPARLGLLKGMDGLLTADLLHVLRSAGHGDEICLVDWCAPLTDPLRSVRVGGCGLTARWRARSNFPAASTAVKTVTGAPIVLAGIDLPSAVDSICSIMPLDFFVECPALYMAPEPGNELPPAGAEVHAALTSAHPHPAPPHPTLHRPRR